MKHLMFSIDGIAYDDAPSRGHDLKLGVARNDMPLYLMPPHGGMT